LAGIYLHIPFCKQACAYCNFHFTTSLRYKDDLVKALAKEAEQEKDYLEGTAINTIYFGGGTPSLLEVSELHLLIAGLRKHYAVSPEAEITIEANPDDINEERLRAWKDLGINRLSIGIQSFFEEELRWMNRAHNVQQSYQCIEQSLKAGFDNFSIDLIYGSPLLTDEMWKQNVDTATGYGITHLSCYALTVEEKTPLHKEVQLKQKDDVENEKQGRQFFLLMQWLREKGYEHYEVSNFAKRGYRSRHNSSYWKGIPYLGLGPSAHSYNGSERRWNLPNNTIYIQSVHDGEAKRELETLTEIQKLNEHIMISLRTNDGLDLDSVERNWGIEIRKELDKDVMKFYNNGLVRFSGTRIQLTDEGMLKADGIAGELFR